MSIKQEMENEVMMSIVSGILPKVKKLLPMMTRKLKDSEGLIGFDEVITIGRKSNKEIIVVRTKANNTDIEIKDSSKLEVFTIETLIEKIMNIEELED